MVDPENFYDLGQSETPVLGADLMEVIVRQEEIRGLANDDPAFAEPLGRYETIAHGTTTCRLVGQLDDKAWERRWYEELQLQHEIEDMLKKRQDR